MSTVHRSRRAIARVLILAVVLAMTSFHAAAAAWTFRDATFDTGEIGVTMADRDGVPLTRPLFDNVTVDPGMAPLVTAFTVVNRGGIPVRFALDFSSNDDSTSAGLASRLMLVIRQSASGAVVYNGALDRLRIVDPDPLRPAANEGYTITTTWPPGTDDSRFQRQSADFDITLRAAAVR